MNKQTFLDTLRSKLTGLGINETAINNQINQFDRYFSILPPEEAEKQLNNISDIDAIARNICSLLKASEPSKQPAEDESEETAEPQTESENETSNTDSYIETEPEEELSDISGSKAPPSDVEAYIPKEDLHNTDNIYIEGEAYTAEQPFPVRKQTEQLYDRDARYDRAVPASVPMIDINSIDYDHESDSRYYNYDTNDRKSKKRRDNIKGSPLFWALFFLTFPIWGAIVFVMYALFFSLFTVSAVLIFASILLLAAVVIAGAGFSLYGIIYGIVQTFTVLSPGLFEIGLGITIGGITMFAGILIYNFAVRLLPFTMKMLFKLLCFINEKLVDLFYYVKKECSR